MKFSSLLQKIGLGRRHPPLSFPEMFGHFQHLIAENNRALEIMADMGEKLSGEYVFDRNYLVTCVEDVTDCVHRMIYHMDSMAPGRFAALFPVYNALRAELDSELRGELVIPEGDYVIDYAAIDDTLETLVGGKNSHLGIASSVLNVRVPDGFAITSRCFDVLLRQGATGEKIGAILDHWKSGALATSEASTRLQDIVMAIRLPQAMRRAITGKIAAIVNRYRFASGTIRFAVRSSAIGEDGELSYAGQYRSILNTYPDDVLHAYLQVLASHYSARAMEYRRSMGVEEAEAAMAVGVQRMVEARVSGVVYTLNASRPEENSMLISATYGLGADLVGGGQQADQFEVSRIAPYPVTGMNIVYKDRILERSTADGVEHCSVEPQLRDRPCLQTEELRDVVARAMELEGYFRQPQDIEFALDERHELVILQVRPLNIRKAVPRLTCDFSEIADSVELVLDGVGDVVQEGVGMGAVYQVRSEQELDQTPQGCILVAHFSSPNLARVLRRVNGVITDIGSPIGHLSTIAREFRVPMIVNTRQATRLLAPGMEITLDGRENRVYAGLMPQLCYYEFSEDPFEESVEFRLLRRLVKKIGRLFLVDPSAGNFTVSACRTLHDIIRFIHEKSVETLMDRNYAGDRFLRDHAVRLGLEIPLDLTLIDLDRCGACAATAAQQGHRHAIRKSEEAGRSGCSKKHCGQYCSRRSELLQSFIDGMSLPGLWARDPVAVDMRSFMASMTRTFSPNMADPRFVGQNLAITNGDYMNVSLRLGYHFSMVDAICSPEEIDNYIYFRFFGGVTEDTRRMRRGDLIRRILMAGEFMVSNKKDLVVGRIRGVDRAFGLEKIFLLGALVSFTRQLDVKMSDESSVGEYADRFADIMERAGRNVQNGAGKELSESARL